MKKFIKNILIFSTACAATTAPLVTSLVSCSKKHVNVEIQSLKLAARPTYICPGESLQIHKVTVPSSAVDNDTTWEIVDCPIEGFTISKKGKISAPSSFSAKPDAFLRVKATDVLDPTVSDTISIAIVESVEKDRPFIGFVGNKVDYYTRKDEIESVNILKVGDKAYETEKPINLFIGRTNDAFEFNPIILKGFNSRMKFHLHGGDETLHALSWMGYSDNTWTDTIPSLSVTFVQHRHDSVDVTFACDKEVTFRLNFNVWQSEQQSTPGMMLYDAPETDPHYHELHDVGLGMYSSYIDIPENSTETEATDVLDNLVIYRKPYEYLDELTFKIIPYDTPYVTDEQLKAEVTSSRRETIWPIIEHDGYRLNINIKFDPSKIHADDYQYEEIPLFVLQAWDPFNEISPLCYCTFYAHWVNE